MRFLELSGVDRCSGVDLYLLHLDAIPRNGESEHFLLFTRS